MKRHISLLLTFVLLVILSMAYAEDYSGISNEELIQRDNDIRQELISRQLEENGKILVLDEYGVKIYFDGFAESSAYGDVIRFVVMNNSEGKEPLIVSVEELYIDNWDVLYNGYIVTLEPGKSGVGEPMMDWSKCMTADQKSATRIDVRFALQVEESEFDWKILHTTELITFYIN